MKIDIKGTIIPNDDAELYEWFGLEAVCPNNILNALNEAKGDSVDVYINSGGGDVFSASEIYSALREYNKNIGDVNIHVVGSALSAASIIMCAAECDISPTSLVMIHNVSSRAEGNYRDMNKESDNLRKADEAVCAAYVHKTGKPENEWLEMMDKETWLTAKEAVELGLCDKISGNNREALINAYCTILSDGQRKEYENAKNKLRVKLKLLEAKANEK